MVIYILFGIKIKKRPNILKRNRLSLIWGKMEQKDVAITYETLFEILRLEKGREELQKLKETFFEDVADYIEEKNKILNNSANKMDLFSSTEKEKTRQQIQNTKRILKEIYDRRERKTLNLAIIKAKTGSSAIDTSGMLQLEKQMFEELTFNLDNYRKGILINLFNAKIPQVKERNDIKGQEEDNKKEEKEKFMMIRFKKQVPQFVGKELETYGPFEEDDASNIPTEIATLLIGKGRAELME